MGLAPQFSLGLMLVAMLIGCGTTGSENIASSHPVYNASTAEQDRLWAQSNALRNKRDSLKQARSIAEVQSDIERLEREIRELEERLAELDRQLDAYNLEFSTAQEARPARSPDGSGISPASSYRQAPSGNLYGPRGGCYRITKSGKKNYGAC